MPCAGRRAEQSKFSPENYVCIIKTTCGGTPCGLPRQTGFTFQACLLYLISIYMRKKKSKKKQGKNWKKFWKLGVEEFNTQYFDITKEGELTVREGNYIYNLNDIVKKYGSPTEVVFPFILEERLEDLHDYFQAYMKIQGYK